MNYKLTQGMKKYDLEERTLVFSKEINSLCKKIKITFLNKNIMNQLLRSSSSVGANYCEANGAISKKDFANKIHICKKEAKESHYWLSLLKGTVEDNIASEVDKALKEAKEILLIFSKIASSSRKLEN